MKDRALHQKRIVKAVLERYNAAAGTAYTVTRWPDEEERNVRACDAYAEDPGHVPLATEHTTLPTFEFQKQHDAQFMKAIGDLEREIKNAFPYHLALIVPMFAVQKGQDWGELKNTIKEWLLSNIAAIRLGPSKFSIPGVPFEVTLDRDDDMPPFFTVARWLDPALNVAEQLTEGLAVALADKDNQLSQYHNKAGNTTLLILVSSQYCAEIKGTPRTLPVLDLSRVAE